MSIFRRIFKVGQSEAHAIVNKLEDPIKMTEQGIRDLKNDLQGAMTGLAEVKGVAIRLGKEGEDAKRQASEYERKAMLLLQSDVVIATLPGWANGSRTGRATSHRSLDQKGKRK